MVLKFAINTTLLKKLYTLKISRDIYIINKYFRQEINRKQFTI